MRQAVSEIIPPVCLENGAFFIRSLLLKQIWKNFQHPIKLMITQKPPQILSLAALMTEMVLS